MADQENASFLGFIQRARGVQRGVEASDAEPGDDAVLTASDIGEGVQVPEPATTVHAYLPYAEAWKEFDKLQKRAKGATVLGSVHWMWGFVASTVPIFTTLNGSPKKIS